MFAEPKKKPHPRLAVYSFIVIAVVVVLVVRGGTKGGDFRAYWLAANGLLDGDLVPAYGDAERPFQYPPFFAFLVAPAAWLPEDVGRWLWSALKGALVLLLFRGVQRKLGLVVSAEAAVAGFFFAVRPLDSDFANGNANVVVLALVLLGFECARLHRDGWGGIAFASGILSKVTPVLLLPWVAVRRRWPLLLRTLVAVALLGWLLPVLALGWGDAHRAWGAWGRGTLSIVDVTSDAYARDAGAGYVPGQSLRALFHRLLRATDATAHDEGKVVSINWVNFDKLTVDGIYLAVSALVLGGVWFAFRRRNPGMRGGWTPGEIAAAIALVPLLAPLSRKAHFVLLWPAAVLAFEAWWRSCGRRRWLGGALWAFALAALVLTSRDVIGRTGSLYAMAYCPYSLASVLLVAILLHPGLHPPAPRSFSLERSVGYSKESPGT